MVWPHVHGDRRAGPVLGKPVMQALTKSFVTAQHRSRSRMLATSSRSTAASLQSRLSVFRHAGLTPVGGRSSTEPVARITPDGCVRMAGAGSVLETARISRCRHVHRQSFTGLDRPSAGAVARVLIVSLLVAARRGRCQFLAAAGVGCAQCHTAAFGPALTRSA